MKRELTLEEVKQKQLDIMDEVDKFCVENDIDYSLTYGTLIGAIRHKGYIPWDDDIDIFMTRPQYEKFFSIFNSEGKKLRAVNHSLDKNYPFTFGKVIDTTTEVIETSELDYPMGINIDIFPIDGIDDDEKLLKRQIFFRALVDLKSITPAKTRSNFKNLIVILSHIVLAPIPVTKIVGKMVDNAKSHDFDKSKKVCCSAFGSKLNRPVDKSWFDEYVRVPFEDREFFVTTHYDDYLRSVFGDYMQLPPEEERVTHHSYKAYEK